MKRYCIATGPCTESNQVCPIWKAKGKQAPFLAFSLPSPRSSSSGNWFLNISDMFQFLSFLEVWHTSDFPLQGTGKLALPAGGAVRLLPQSSRTWELTLRNIQRTNKLNQLKKQREEGGKKSRNSRKRKEWSLGIPVTKKLPFLIAEGLSVPLHSVLGSFQKI